MAVKRTKKPQVGRPTRYLTRYCDAVRRHAKIGMSKCEIATTLGVSIRVLYDWEKRHPEFLQAMGDARQLSQAWWEKQGRLHLTAHNEDAKINAALYSRSMAARFPDDWREKSEVKQDVSVSTKLTESERAAKLSGLLDTARARGAGSVAADGSEEVDPAGGAAE